jgi:hypothetical protein
MQATEPGQLKVEEGHLESLKVKKLEWVESQLPIIKTYFEEPKKSHQFQIMISLDEEEVQQMRHAAKAVGLTPEKFLQMCARLGLEEELEPYK